MSRLAGGHAKNIREDWRSYGTNSVEHVTDAAGKWLERFVKRRRFETPKGVVQLPCAVVFDIDDTVIYDNETDVGEPNSVVIDLYHQCLKLKVYVYFVTAREDSTENRKFTSDQLRSFGITTWQGLYLCPPSERESTEMVAAFKRRMRIEIRDHLLRRNSANVNKAAAFRDADSPDVYYDTPIAFTIGDQWTDLCLISNSRDMDTLNKRFSHSYNILQLRDNIACWGLKLMDPESDANSTVIREGMYEDEADRFTYASGDESLASEDDRRTYDSSDA